MLNVLVLMGLLLSVAAARLRFGPDVDPGPGGALSSTNLEQRAAA